MTFGVELVNIAYLQIEIMKSINNRIISGNEWGKKKNNFKFSFFVVVYNRSKAHKTWFIWKWFFSLNSCYRCYKCYKGILLNVHSLPSYRTNTYFISYTSHPFYRSELKVRLVLSAKYVSNIEYNNNKPRSTHNGFLLVQWLRTQNCAPIHE